MNTQRDHLDAETVAAWLDGGLDAVSLAAAEAHASNCERCRALIATVVKTIPEGIPHPNVGATSSWWKWWMAPLAATAAAVTLWMVVPEEQLQPQKATVASDAEIAAPTASAPAAQSRDEAASAREEPPQLTQANKAAAKNESTFDELKRRAEASPKQEQQQGKVASAANAVEALGVRERRDAKTEEPLARLEAEPARAAAPPAAAPAAPPAEIGALRDTAAVSQLRKQTGPLELLSPDPQRRWRIVANGVERSEDGGRTWVVVRLSQGETITAGASPSPMACWLVGRGGLVLVATDGTNFTRLPFPEPVDLTAVSSPELRIAVVTTADGRVFRTENAGRTWTRQ